MDTQNPDPKRPAPAIRLADGQPCALGSRVFATQCSSRGNYIVGDIGCITRINAAGPFVRWNHSGKETQASIKRLQAVPRARDGVPIELADGRPVRPGLRVAAIAATVNGVEKGAVGTITLVAVSGNEDLVEVLWDGPDGGKSTVNRLALQCMDSRMLRLATFNIGTRCQSLRVAGSEAGTVQRMVDVRGSLLCGTVFCFVHFMSLVFEGAWLPCTLTNNSGFALLHVPCRLEHQSGGKERPNLWRALVWICWEFRLGFHSECFFLFFSAFVVGMFDA